MRCPTGLRCAEGKRRLREVSGARTQKTHNVRCGGDQDTRKSGVRIEGCADGRYVQRVEAPSWGAATQRAEGLSTQGAELRRQGCGSMPSKGSAQLYTPVSTIAQSKDWIRAPICFSQVALPGANLMTTRSGTYRSFRRSMHCSSAHPVYPRVDGSAHDWHRRGVPT